MANPITSLIGRLKKGTKDVADTYTTRVKANYSAIRDELRDVPAQADKIIQGGNVYKDTFGYKNPQGLAQKSANTGLGLLDNIGSGSVRGVVNTGKSIYDLGRLGYGLATGNLASQPDFKSRGEYLGMAGTQTGDAFRFGGTVTPLKSVQALKAVVPSIGLYSGLEGGLNVLNDKSDKSMRMKFAEGAVSGLERGVPMAGVGVVSNPLISKAMDKRFTTLGKLAVGVPANIAEGYAMNKSAGMDYAKEDALIDALVPGGLVLGKTSIDSIKNAIAGGVKSKKITPEVAKNLEGYLYKNGRKYWNVRNGTGYARKEDVKKLTPYNTVKTYFTKQKISDINTGKTIEKLKPMKDSISNMAKSWQNLDIYDKSGKLLGNTEQFRKFLADNPELAAFAPISTPEITYDENGKMQFKQGEYNLGERALAFGALKGVKSGQSLIKSSADDVINAFKKQIGETKVEIPLKKQIGGAWDTFYRDWVNRFQPVEDLVKNVEKRGNISLLPQNNPTIQIKRLLGAGGIAEYRHKTKLQPILDSIKNDISIEDFDVFLKAKRDMELAGRGVRGSNAEQANAVIQALGSKYDLPKIEQASQALYKYQDEGLQMLRDGGFIDESVYNVIKDANKNYVPFQRVMDEVDNYLGLPTSKLQNPSQPLKKIEGSNRAIYSPIESIIANTYKIESAVSKNKVAKSIAGLSNLAPDLVKPLRIAENVKERIDLFSQAKELKPLQGRLERLLTTRNRWSRSLQSELNRLNTRGMKLSIKPKPNPLPSVTSGITAKVKYQSSRVLADTEDFWMKHLKSVEYLPNQKELNSRQVKQLVNSMIQEPNSVLENMKRTIGRKDQALSELIGEVQSLKGWIDDIKSTRSDLISEGRKLLDSRADKKENVISVWNNGIKEQYEVDADISQAVKGLNEEQLNTIWRVLSAPASILRQQATGRNLEFMIPNVVRDQIDAAINAKYGYVPFWDYMRGLKDLIQYEATGSNPIVEGWIQNGGQMFFESMSGRKAIQKQIMDATQKKRLTRKLYDLAINGIETVGKYSETPTRLGVYKRALEKTGNMAISAGESREATLDFARRGAKMSQANAVIPFLNASIQGFDKMARSIKERPAKALTLMTIYGGMPALMTTLYNNLNFSEEYANVPDFIKNDNFVLMTGGTDGEGNPKYITIPKSHAVKPIANATQQMVDYWSGSNPQTFKQFALNTLSSTVPLLGEGNNFSSIASNTLGSNLPQAIKPAIQQVTNYDFYRNKPIVPPYMTMSKKPLETQFNRATPDIYKRVGALTGTSPLRLQNFAESTLPVAKQITNVMDVATSMRDGDPVNPNKIPVIRRFSGSQSGFDNERPVDIGTNVGEKVMEFLRPNSQSSAASKEPVAMDEKTVKKVDNIAKSYGYDSYLGEKPTGSLELKKYQKDVLSEAKKVLKDEYMKESDKLALVQRMGYDAEDIKYDILANSETVDRAIYVRDELAKVKTDEDRRKLLTDLYNNKSISDSRVFTESVAEELGLTDAYKIIYKEAQAKKKKTSTKKLKTPKISFKGGNFKNGRKLTTMQMPKLNIKFESPKSMKMPKTDQGKSNVMRLQKKVASI